MKAAISVSGDVFKLSEELVKKLKASRTRIFAMGVEKLLVVIVTVTGT